MGQIRVGDGEADAPRTPSSVVAGRLALEADEYDVLPGLADLGLTLAHARAVDWQGVRSRFEFLQAFLSLSSNPGKIWVRDIAGILGATAEQILVGIELEVEKSITAAFVANLDPESSMGLYAAKSRSLRAFAEAQANAIVVALHGVANCAVRALEYGGTLEPRDLRAMRLKKAQFRPGSEESGAWASFNNATVHAIAVAAGERGEKFEELASTLRELVSDPRIEKLLDIRNVQYHRWRGESPGVSGVDFGVSSVEQRLATGETVYFGGTESPYTEGESILGEVVQVSRQALDGFVANMAPILIALLAVQNDALPSKIAYTPTQVESDQ